MAPITWVLLFSLAVIGSKIFGSPMVETVNAPPRLPVSFISRAGNASGNGSFHPGGAGLAGNWVMPVVVGSEPLVELVSLSATAVMLPVVEASLAAPEDFLSSFGAH